MTLSSRDLFFDDGLVLKGEKEAIEGGGEGGGEQRGEDGGSDEPDDEGVPLPGPEEAGGVPWVVADAGEECGPAEGEAGGVEDGAARADEDEEKT